MRKICFFLCLILLLPFEASAAEQPKYIALTFDDGPSGLYTRALLAGLAVRDTKATFFLCGYRAEQYPELTEQIFQAGHEIGIHGYSHKNMVPLSRRDIAGEIRDTMALLPEKCPVRLLRPPGGCCSDGVNQVAGAMGLAVIGWSVDPKDWAIQDTAAVGRSVLEQVRDGDIILMHDTSESSVNAALNIVDILHKRGFRFVTVSELARLRETRLIPGANYRRFPPEE
jgi:peptidoglycan/xylan/chitin deacetylase (PgdA/CDA1 family)